METEPTSEFLTETKTSLIELGRQIAFQQTFCNQNI